MDSNTIEAVVVGAVILLVVLGGFGMILRKFAPWSWGGTYARRMRMTTFLALLVGAGLLLLNLFNKAN